MKAPGPNCPALAIWKPDVEVLACVDQSFCGWEQHKTEADGSVTPSWLCRVQRAPELCTAQQGWCGGLCPAFGPAQALVEDKLPPGASCFLAVQHGTHLLPCVSGL